MTGGNLNLDALRNEFGSLIFRTLAKPVDERRSYVADELRLIAERIDEEARPLWSR